MENQPNINVIEDRDFNPKDHSEDPRVSFKLVLKDGNYVCSLCNHRLQVSNAAVGQLKSAHLRNAVHQKVMKRRLGIEETKSQDGQNQRNTITFFKPLHGQSRRSSIKSKFKIEEKENQCSGDLERKELISINQEADDLRRAELLNLFLENNTSVEEIGRLFFVPCKGSMPSGNRIKVDLENVKVDQILPFCLHPVMSSGKVAKKYNNMNKWGFHTQGCNLYTTDRQSQVNAECRAIAAETELIELINRSSNCNHKHSDCNSIGHSKSRTGAVMSKHAERKRLKRALEKLARMKSRENTYNEVMALMSQNEMGVAYRILNQFRGNPNKMLEMTGKILEHDYRPSLGNENSNVIKKYMMISIMAGSQLLQVLSFFDYQSKHFPKTIREKVVESDKH